MFLPVFTFIIIFKYIPMYGIRIAFYDFGIFGIKDFIGLKNFRLLWYNPRFWDAFKNTLILSSYNIMTGMFASITMALLLNEICNVFFKKVVQTIIYLPHFLSWVVVASIFTMVLSPESGILNEIIKQLGGEPIYFLISEKWWRSIFIFISRWKETGWSTIIYLAAISNIDPQLYDAASVDGAGKFKQTLHITIPSIKTTILIVFILSLSSVLDLFMPVFVLYNPLVHSVSDVIETYTYRVGLIQADYDYSTAVGLVKSIISMILVLLANKFSKKLTGENIL